MPHPPRPEATDRSALHLDNLDGPGSGHSGAVLANPSGQQESRFEPAAAIATDIDTVSLLRTRSRRRLPWWKRPSPWWLFGFAPFMSIATSAALAPRIEVFTLVVCNVYKPEIFQRPSTFTGLGTAGGLPQGYVVSGLSSFLVASSNGPRPSEAALWSNVRESVPQIASTGKELEHECASDPEVQAEVAKLAMMISMTMGVLSCLTAAWWGSFSDRHGRMRVIRFVAFGGLFAECNFVFVALNFRHLPGGYWSLLIGPVVEGFFGGLAAEGAALHAYVSDIATEAERSGIFSLGLGLTFCGVALGPTLGALLIRFTHNALYVFYAVIISRLLFFAYVCFVVPESLSPEQMLASQTKYEEELKELNTQYTNSIFHHILFRAKTMLAFLNPLMVFIPKMGVQGGNLLKGMQDWNLTWLAVGYGLHMTIMGSYMYKFQYAAAAFGWTAETLGYWISLVSVTHAVFLTVIFPLIVKFFKSKPDTSGRRSRSEREPLLASPETPTTSESRPKIHTIAFDMAIARGSLALDIIAYATVALVTTVSSFTISALLGAFGAGMAPAVQSVAVALYSRRGGTESGKLFGALSVVRAMCSQILGPTLFGLVYMRTVETFPRAIFIVTAGTVVLSFVCLMLVRIPKDLIEGSESQDEEDGRSAGDRTSDEQILVEH